MNELERIIKLKILAVESTQNACDAVSFMLNDV